MRLLCTLQAVQPQGTRDFANLAAVHIRPELLDLVLALGVAVGDESGRIVSWVGTNTDIDEKNRPEEQ
jgi:hypothetical protein